MQPHETESGKNSFWTFISRNWLVLLKMLEAYDDHNSPMNLQQIGYIYLWICSIDLEQGQPCFLIFTINHYTIIHIQKQSYLILHLIILTHLHFSE